MPVVGRSLYLADNLIRQLAPLHVRDYFFEYRLRSVVGRPSRRGFDFDDDDDDAMACSPTYRPTDRPRETGADRHPATQPPAGLDSKRLGRDRAHAAKPTTNHDRRSLTPFAVESVFSNCRTFYARPSGNQKNHKLPGCNRKTVEFETFYGAPWAKSR